jgi:protoporphyrinogen oxidase
MNFILGAGFAGLGAGIKTGFPIYEASNNAGGICRDYVKDGFTFSNGGGHYLFGKGPGLDYIKSLVPVNEIERKAGVYYNHTFPYPFQTTASQDIIDNDKYRLDKYDFRQSLRTSLLNKFGKEQCNLFFHPFNEKYTAGLYDKVIQVDDYKSPPAGGKGFCPTFCDPVNGLSDLVDKMASKCDIKYGKRVINIFPEHKKIEFQGDSHAYSYDKLISTIPLNKLMEMCGPKVNLPYTSVLVINIGAEVGACTPKEHWMYIPFSKTPFYRVGFYSNIHQNKAPKGTVGLSVEIAFLPDQKIDIPKITRDVIQELQEWRWIDNCDPIVVDPTWVPCAYTWLYDRKDRDDAIAWLKERDIISIGRYGKWSFQGMVESLGDGLNVNLD